LSVMLLVIVSAHRDCLVDPSLQSPVQWNHKVEDELCYHKH
jgi:hypothetical protein